MNNFNTTPRNQSEYSNSANSGWDSLKDLNRDFSSEASNTDRPKSQAMRKADIINVTLKRQEVTDPDNISGAAIDEAFQYLSDFYHRDQNRSNLISSLADMPAQINPEQAINSINSNSHQSYILNYMAGRNAKGNSAPNDLKLFLQTYPTPVEFADASNTFINNLALVGNSPAKVEEYARDMEKFKHNVYGEQQDYFEALEELDEIAHSRAQAHGTIESAALKQAQDEVRLAYQREHAQEISNELLAHHQNNPYAAPEVRNSTSPEPTEPKKPGLFGKFFGRKK